VQGYIVLRQVLTVKLQARANLAMECVPLKLIRRTGLLAMILTNTRLTTFVLVVFALAFCRAKHFQFIIRIELA
jgi:hypothetical protein